MGSQGRATTTLRGTLSFAVPHFFFEATTELYEIEFTRRGESFQVLNEPLFQATVMQPRHTSATIIFKIRAGSAGPLPFSDSQCTAAAPYVSGIQKQNKFQQHAVTLNSRIFVDPADIKSLKVCQYLLLVLTFQTRRRPRRFRFHWRSSVFCSAALMDSLNKRQAT